MVVREKEVMEVMSQQFIIDDRLEWKKAQNIDKKANTITLYLILIHF